VINQRILNWDSIVRNQLGDDFGKPDMRGRRTPGLKLSLSHVTSMALFLSLLSFIYSSGYV
jgi:hypothetical protein